jgi:hypothetical protein
MKPGDLVRISFQKSARFKEHEGELGVIINVDVEGDGAAFYFVLLRSGTWWFVRTELALVNDGTDGYDSEKETE